MPCVLSSSPPTASHDLINSPPLQLSLKPRIPIRKLGRASATMAGWQGVWQARRPTLPPMPPPKRQKQLDDSATPVSGAPSAALLAQAPRPPWLLKASAERQAIADRWEHGGRPPTTSRFLNRPTPGMPPPPVSAIGNPKLIARHANKWNGQTTMAAHFRPDRHTGMINGRPMQARGG